MILTDDEKLSEKIRYLSTQAKDDPVRYIHYEIGYNFRLTNIQAALGVAQMEQLQEFLKRKLNIYKKYLSSLNDVKGLSLLESPNYADTNHWMNIIQIDSSVYGEDRDTLMLRLEENGIQTRPVWALNHLQEPYKNFQNYRIEHSESLVKNSLCLPSSTNLSDKNLNKVITLLNG